MAMCQIRGTGCLCYKVLLEPKNAHLFVYCFGYFQTTMAKLSICNRNLTTHKALSIYYLVLYRKKFAESCTELGTCLTSSETKLIILLNACGFYFLT